MSDTRKMTLVERAMGYVHAADVSLGTAVRILEDTKPPGQHKALIRRIKAAHKKVEEV